MITRDYLARINYTGELSPTAGVLSALQEAHLLAVPFENLDIHLGRRIVLDPDRLFTKIVTMNRGGFCYELNFLFSLLLLDLGFHLKLVSGRVFDRDRNDYGPEFDHMLSLADVDGQAYLVDVGYGDFSMHPLKFTLNRQLTDTNGQFLIERHIDECFKVSRFSQAEKQYLPEYIFTTTERRISDFSEMCSYHQTSPESHFTRKRVCSIATTTGRITLTDDRLIVTHNGLRNESIIRGGQEFRLALVQYFNITL